MKKLIPVILLSSLLLISCEAVLSMLGLEDTDDIPIKLGLVISGQLYDDAFNEAAYEALLNAESELNANIKYYISDGDNSLAIGNAVADDLDLIWTVGFLLTDATLTAAQSNPGQDFAIVDVVYDNTPNNLMGSYFNVEDASFLAGYLAGKMTETDKVGFIGGMDISIIHPFHYGYAAGVKQAEGTTPITLDARYVGEFGNPDAGETMADEMYGEGADVIFQAAGGTGLGVITSAVNNEQYVIGVDLDQSELAPSNMLTSVLKNGDVVVGLVSARYALDNFDGGSNFIGTLQNGGTGIAPTLNAVPSAVNDEIATLRQLIIDGTITVPETAAELTAFMPYTGAL